MMRYTIKLAKDDNDTYLATSRDFPELATYGETIDEALRHAREAIEEAIAARLAMGRDVPTGRGSGPHVVTLAPDIELKLRLHGIVGKLGLSKSALARSLDLHRPQLDRLLDPRHETRSADLLAAFGRLGYEVDYRVSVSPRRPLRRRAKAA